ncbi:MAG: M1 family aminopeptidase [Bacteroidales bacterium]
MNLRTLLWIFISLLIVPEILAESAPDTSGFDIKYLRLELNASDTSAFISGKAVCKSLISHDLQKICFEFSEKYLVDSVLVNHFPASWMHQNNLLNVYGHFTADDLVESEIYYHGNAGGSGFFSGITNKKDAQWNIPVTWTLSEPFAARDWFPAKQVLSDKIDSSEVILTVPPWCMAGSNGVLAGVDTLPDKRVRFHWKSHYPIAYYLISMAVANYQNYTLYARPYGLDDSLPVVNFVYNIPSLLESSKKDIDRTKDFIEYYSALLEGYPFPDEKYGHCLAPMGGGMEHQTMTTLSNFGFLLVSHELFHMWFGDMVTCASWSDIWLNEGFASYGEYLALNHFEGKESADAWMSQAHAFAFAMPEGSVYVPPEEADNVYRIFNYNLSYKKGAAILHMLRMETANDSVFFKALRDYLRRFKYSVASVNDFINTFQQVTGKDWQYFFEQWYYGSGYPVVQIEWQQIGNHLLLNIQQHGSSSKTPVFRFSLPLTFYYPGGDSTVTIRIDQAEQSLAINFPHRITGIAADTGSDVLAKVTVIPMDTSGKYLLIYPNPAARKVALDFYTKDVNRTITVISLSGQVTGKLNSRESHLELDVSHWTPGVYVVMVTENNIRYAARLVIP